MARPKYVQARKTTLSVGISSTEATEIKLKDLKDLYGNDLAFSDFVTQIYVTINPGAESEEIVSATGFTVNSDGTVSIDTGITRSLKGVSGYGSGGTATAHAAGTVVVVSNNPQIYEDILAYIDGISLAGVSDASTTSAGVVEEATEAEINADTGSGATTRRLFINPSTLRTSQYGVRLPTANEKNALAGQDATPSTTEPYLTRASGRLNVLAKVAGETIAGATVPVACFQNKSDNEFYACDANDTTKYKFNGFGISAGTDGNAISIQFSGIVKNFTGLQEGEKYYVQDDKTIGTSPGTQEILVGVAISETELVIMKGRRYASGALIISDAGGDNAVIDTVIDVGFRISLIHLSLHMRSTTLSGVSNGSWHNDIYSCAFAFGGATGTQGIATDVIGKLYADTTLHWELYIFGGISDTGFTIRSQQRDQSPVAATYSWIAFGEL